MDYLATSSNKFLETAKRWIEENEEVLVLVRFHACAGNKSWEFYGSYELLEQRLLDLPAQTSVIIFQEHEFDLKGRVDKDFIKRAIDKVKNQSDWMLIWLEKVVYGSVSWFRNEWGQTSDELKEELLDEEIFGKLVVVGKEPDWIDDHEGLIAAVVPHVDGSVQCGIY